MKMKKMMKDWHKIRIKKIKSYHNQKIYTFKLSFSRCSESSVLLDVNDTSSLFKDSCCISSDENNINNAVRNAVSSDIEYATNEDEENDERLAQDTNIIFR
jgi:hypothetical protein